MENNFNNLKGKVILFSGGSGVGKGTMIKKLLNKYPHFVQIISATTRNKREGEIEGKEYFFKTTEEFKKMIENNEFIEWAYIHHSFYYGTPKKQLFDALEKGKTVIMEINYEGFLNMKTITPKHILTSIFMLPPSIDTLKQRILNRAKISDKELDKRINYSLTEEMKVASLYDIQFQPIDGDIEKSFEELEKIIFKNINFPCLQQTTHNYL